MGMDNIVEDQVKEKEERGGGSRGFKSGRQLEEERGGGEGGSDE